MDKGFESPKAIRVTDHHTIRAGAWTACASKIERTVDGRKETFGQVCFYEGTSWRGCRRLPQEISLAEVGEAMRDFLAEYEEKKAEEAEAKEREEEENAGESE